MNAMGQTRATGERREVFGTVIVGNEAGSSGSPRSWRIGVEIGGSSSGLERGYWTSALLRWVRVFLRFMSFFILYLARVGFVWRASVEVLRAFSATKLWLAVLSETAWLGRGGAEAVRSWFAGAADLEAWYYVPRLWVAVALALWALGLVDYSAFPGCAYEKGEFRHLMLSVLIARGIVCALSYVNADSVVVGSFFSVALVPTELRLVNSWFDRGVSRLLLRVRGVDDGGGLFGVQEVLKYALFGLLYVVPGGWSVVGRGLVVWLAAFLVAVFRAAELSDARVSSAVAVGNLVGEEDGQVFHDAESGEWLLDRDEAVLAEVRRVFPLPLALVPDDVLRISLENIRVGPSSGSHAEVRRYALLGDRLLGHALVQKAFDAGWAVGDMSLALGSVVTNKNFAIYYDQEFRPFVCGEEKLSEKRAGTFVEALVGMSVIYDDVRADAVVEFLRVQLGFNVV